MYHSSERLLGDGIIQQSLPLKSVRKLQRPATDLRVSDSKAGAALRWPAPPTPARSSAGGCRDGTAPWPCGSRGCPPTNDTDQTPSIMGWARSPHVSPDAHTVLPEYSATYAASAGQNRSSPIRYFRVWRRTQPAVTQCRCWNTMHLPQEGRKPGARHTSAVKVAVKQLPRAVVGALHNRPQVPKQRDSVE
jgi:hypothetical protein